VAVFCIQKDLVIQNNWIFLKHNFHNEVFSSKPGDGKMAFHYLKAILFSLIEAATFFFLPFMKFKPNF